MKKLILFIITSILFTVIYLSVQGTYGIYVKTVNKTLTVTTPKLEAVFLNGQEFNVKIKTLAGDNNPSYNTDNTNITSIERANILTITPTIDNVVSDSTSSFPIYAWYDSGVIYYYTEVEHPYMNENSNGMFRNLLNLVSIDISTIDTSIVTGMNSMFWYDSSIVSLDLSTFNTSNVIYMGAMFEYCTNLKNINLSSFNTSKVEQFTYMFRYMSEIESLDLSSFNMNAATNNVGMINGLTNLKELKTPKVYPNDTSVTIDLPKTMYDSNSVGYSSLGKNTSPSSPTQAWIKEAYTVTFDYNDATGNNSTSSKTVRYGDNYGTLPAPTREGYTFTNWEGGSKNLFNQDLLLNIEGATYTNNHYQFTFGNAAIKYGSSNDYIPISNVKPNTAYTLTVTGYVSEIPPQYSACFFYFLYTDNSISYEVINSTSESTYTYTSNVNKSLKGIGISYGSGSAYTAYISQVQLEEGSVATTYEPYYVTSNTTVTKSENHTLKALWTPQTYIVSFDANGGNVGTVSKQVTYNSEYGGLPTPTKTGYKFEGWVNSLPSDYKQLKYIESNGTQYIDTDINPTGIKLGVDLTFKVNNTTNDRWMFGGHIYDSGNIGGYLLGVYADKFYFGIWNHQKQLIFHNMQYTSDTNIHNVKINISGYGSSFDGTMIQNEYGNNSGIVIDQADYTAYIFGRNSNLSGAWSSVRIYSLKLYNGTNIIRYYIPCYKISTGKAGLYDLISETFYPNESNGTDFTYEINNTDLSEKYITSSSKVEQAKNHTLKAIWSSTLTNNIVNYTSTSSSQEFIAPKKGTYEIELWGASGGDAMTTFYQGCRNPEGGKGSYTKGLIDLEKGESIYLYVGGKGTDATTVNTYNAGGYNGGGLGGNGGSDDSAGGGGGATDIRLVDGTYNSFDSLKSRIMVASGGGGGSCLCGNDTFPSDMSIDYRNGSGLENPQVLAYGYYSFYTCNISSTTQTSGSSFGLGNDGNSSSHGTGGGGAGYYGGTYCLSDNHGSGGSGGTSFISGHNGSNSISASSTSSNITHTGSSTHYSGKTFRQTEMIDGSGCKWTNTKTNDCSGQIQPDGTTALGHTGNGYIRIRYIDAGETWNYAYNGTDGTDGSIQNFLAPTSGTYKIETWGAQGGSITDELIGGYGGYSTGQIHLSANEQLYITVGGAGSKVTTSATLIDGGYNGGGKAYVIIGSCGNQGATGGGATHIATSPGLLSDLNTNSILLVSGGGGGSEYRYCGASDDTRFSGGSAGGYIGNNNVKKVCTWNYSPATGGTQSTGGTGGTVNGEPGTENGLFGQGGTSSRTGGYTLAVGGGAGYYGGGAAMFAGGGGGSGYMKSTLTNKKMYCYECAEDGNTNTYTVSTYGETTHENERDTTNCPSGYNSNPVSKCAKAGNGYARITLVSID